MRLRRRHLVFLACTALLAACNAAQFVYNRLDFAVRWELGKYVDLSGEQRARFDTDFRAFWDWHRKTELPRYAAALRKIAARVDTPPDAAELQRWSDEYSQLWTPSLDRLTPLTCHLGASLSDAQVKSLLEQADDDLADYADEYVDDKDAALRAHAERSLAKSLRRWVGELTPAQKQAIHEWNQSRPWVAAQWLAFRRAWRERLAEILAARSAPDFCPKLKQLVAGSDALWTPDQQRDFAANRERWIALFASLGPSLTATQRQHLSQRVLELAADLDALSAPAPGTVATPAGAPAN
ncbi:MAG: DUF6279 family lipoprotein [Solimonas sp.]